MKGMQTRARVVTSEGCRMAQPGLWRLGGWQFVKKHLSFSRIPLPWDLSWILALGLRCGFCGGWFSRWFFWKNKQIKSTTKSTTKSTKNSTKNSTKKLHNFQGIFFKVTPKVTQKWLFNHFWSTFRSLWPLMRYIRGHSGANPQKTPLGHFLAALIVWGVLGLLKGQEGHKRSTFQTLESSHFTGHQPIHWLRANRRKRPRKALLTVKDQSPNMHAR